MKKLLLAGMIVAGGSLTGCAEMDVLVQKQTEMEGRIENLVQGNRDLAARNDDLAKKMDDLRQKVEDLALKLDEPKKTAVAPGPPVVPADIPPADPGPTKIELVSQEGQPEKDAAPSDAYMKAFALYSANKFPSAIEAFTLFIKTWPDSEYAGNAQYWIGECYYTENNLPKALEAFNTVIEEYPKGNKVADAMLKVAYTLQAMKETDKAREILSSLVEKYPSSHAAAKARERLNRR